MNYSKTHATIKEAVKLMTEFYVITTVDEVGIKELNQDEIQLQTSYGYFKNKQDCQECIDTFKELIESLEG